MTEGNETQPLLHDWLWGLWTRPVKTFQQAAQHGAPGLAVASLATLAHALNAIVGTGQAAGVPSGSLDLAAATVVGVLMLAGLQIMILAVAGRLVGWQGSLTTVARCYGLAWAAPLAAGLVIWLPGLLRWPEVRLVLAVLGEVWYWALLFIGVRTYSRLPLWRVALCILPMLVAVDFPLLVRAIRQGM